jgi:hypothetical protein
VGDEGFCFLLAISLIPLFIYIYFGHRGAWLFGGMDIDMDGAMFLCLLVFYGLFCSSSERDGPS